MPTTKRKLTPRQDCETIALTFKPVDKLAEKLKKACGKHLHLELDKMAQLLKDGSSVCLHCGFPFPTKMDVCPNCGTHLQYDNELIRDNRHNINYITALSLEQGQTTEWLVQRQFLIESYIDGQPGEPRTFQTSICEVYRNFISQDGKNVISFRRAWSSFTGWTGHFKTDSPIKYCPKSRYDYWITPRYCDINWDETINPELESELDRRIELYKKAK